MYGRPPLNRFASAGARRAAITVTATCVLLGVCACTGGSAVTAAPQASDPACTAALSAAPATVLGQPRTPLQVLGGAAWGEPAVVLRCGLPELAPTSLDCISINDIDWVIDARSDPVLISSFGRSPAIEVRVPTSYGRTSAADAAVDVSAVARALPKTARACVG